MRSQVHLYRPRRRRQLSANRSDEYRRTTDRVARTHLRLPPDRVRRTYRIAGRIESLAVRGVRIAEKTLLFQIHSQPSVPTMIIRRSLPFFCEFA